MIEKAKTYESTKTRCCYWINPLTIKKTVIVVMGFDKNEDHTFRYSPRRRNDETFKCVRVRDNNYVAECNFKRPTIEDIVAADGLIERFNIVRRRTNIVFNG